MGGAASPPLSCQAMSQTAEPFSNERPPYFMQKRPRLRNSRQCKKVLLIFDFAVPPTRQRGRLAQENNFGKIKTICHCLFKRNCLSLSPPPKCELFLVRELYEV